MPKPTNESTEVVPSPHNDRRQRRKFTAEQKARIVDEADNCQRGELAALLRREGIYASQLTNWRLALRQQGLAGLQPSKPGPKSNLDAKDRIFDKQQKQIERLEKELRISKALITMQEKAHEILGIALPRIEDNEGGDYSNSSHNDPRRFRRSGPVQPWASAARQPIGEWLRLPRNARGRVVPIIEGSLTGNGPRSCIYSILTVS